MHVKKKKTSSVYKNALKFTYRYHIPRSYIKPKDNLIVVFEEEHANPEKIEFLLVNRDIICSYITEYDPPHVRSWARKDDRIKTVVDDVRPAAHLKCPNHKKFIKVEFASFGDPYGACGGFVLGNCTSPLSKQIVEEVIFYLIFFFFFHSDIRT